MRRGGLAPETPGCQHQKPQCIRDHGVVRLTIPRARRQDAVIHLQLSFTAAAINARTHAAQHWVSSSDTLTLPVQPSVTLVTRLWHRAHHPTARCLISRRDDQALQVLSGTVWPSLRRCGPCLACPARMPRGRGVPDGVPIRLQTLGQHRRRFARDLRPRVAAPALSTAGDNRPGAGHCSALYRGTACDWLCRALRPRGPSFRSKPTRYPWPLISAHAS